MNKICLCATVVTLLLSQFRGNGQTPSFSTHISDRQVNAIAQDNRGFIWFGTSHGLNKYDGATYTIYYASEGMDALPNDNIKDIFVGEDGRIWIGTECSFVYRDDEGFHNWNEETVYNPSNRIFSLEKRTIIASGRSGMLRMSTDSLARTLSSYSAPGISMADMIGLSSSTELWIGRSHKDSTFIEVLDKDLSLLQRIYLGQKIRIDALCEYLGQTILVATSKGMICLDSRAKTQIATPSELNTLTAGKRIHFLLPYEGNKLLIGISGEGMWAWSAATSMAKAVAPEQTLPALSYVCFVDRDQNIWLSDRVGEVQFYPHEHFVTHLSPPGETGISPDVKNISFDSYGHLWMTQDGVIKMLDPGNGDFLYSYPGEGSASVIHIDRRGYLWAIVDKNSLEQFRIMPDGISPIGKWTFDVDMDYFCESQEGGIVLPYRYDYLRIGPGGNETVISGHPIIYVTSAMTDPKTRRSFLFSVSSGVYELTQGDEFIPRSNPEMRNIHTGLVGIDGTLWYGTYNKGIFRYNPETSECTSLTVEDGLVGNDIKAMVEDDGGNIWFSTPTNISRYDIHDGTIASFHDDRMTEGNSYNRNAVAKGPDGRLFFGSTGGLTVIDPSLPFPEEKDFPLSIEYISVNQEPVSGRPERLDLGWRHNTIMLRFAALDLGGGAFQNYAYKLEGYDQHDQYTSVGSAIYTNIPPGKYLFKVKSLKGNGIRESPGITLPVRIHPAPWATWGAKILYLILGLLLLTSALRTAYRMKIQKERIALSEQKEELNRERIEMITNISHEFRTPLTLIYGPAKELSKKSQSPEDKALTDHILRNAERLRELSGQVLGQGIRHNDDTVLHLRENDLASVVKSCVENFQYATLEKDIILETRLPESDICVFDEEKVRKIIVNIVNNAIKYTPESGHVTVSMANGNDHVSISVSDDGIGIPEEQRERLFERGERLGAESSGIEGSGIGLNYAQRLATLHKGELTYRPNGEMGSVFSLIIPVLASAYEGEDISAERFNSAEMTEPVSPSPKTGTSLDKEGTVMIVEDNAEVRTFIGSVLGGKYQIVTASDGQEAADNLKISIPDLVVSDILMPNMNGYELCRHIKEDQDLCSTPVILLTAKSDAASSIEGLRSGADAYIPKPFDPDYLLAAAQGLIDNRRRIQRKVLSLTSHSIKEPERTAEAGLNRKDKALLEKVYAIMDENLENESFTIEDMASSLNMSYSSLYSKIKALTGSSPVKFITAYRMNTAKELLEEGILSVSEVGYKVGSPSLSTFSRDFKKYFGVSPSSIFKS